MLASLLMTRSDFNNLVNKIGRKLYGQAYRILSDQEGSEDAVQEVFMKLWKMSSRLEEYESIDALASTMIKNYCIDQIRKQRHTELHNESNFASFLDTEPSPYEKLERNEASGLLHRIINDLPALYREIIRLRDIKELSYEEIAEITGQNINTLRVNLSRARKIVRDEFKKYNNETGGSKTFA